MAKPIPEDVRQEILARFANGETVANLASAFGKHSSTMLENLRNWGADIPKGPTKRKYTAEQKTAAVAKYASGATIQEIANEYGVTFATMKENLGNWGNVSRRRGPQRRLSLQEDYFEEINTADKAYWLGMLLADGSVYGHPHNRELPAGVRLELKKSDEAQVRAFADALSSGAEVKYTTRQKKDGSGTTESAYVIIGCAKMARDLSNKGVVLGKTWEHVDVLPYVPESLQHHFVRGYFDGDGWISYGRNGKDQTFKAIFGMIIHREWFDMLKSWFRSRLELGDTVLTPCAKTDMNGYIQWSGGAQVRRILAHLYAGSTPATRLQRKYDSYLELCNVALL